MALGKSAKYYKANPKAYGKKLEYDKKWNDENKEERNEYKRRHEKRNRDYDENNDKDCRTGKDYDEAVGGYRSVKTNRGRKNEGNR
jgi:hypothetical protein